MGKKRISLPRKLEGRAEGPPSELARQIRTYGVVSLLLVPALGAVWVLEGLWLLKGVLLVVALAAALCGAVAARNAGSEAPAIERGHSPKSGKSLTSMGYWMSVASLAGGAVLLVAWAAWPSGVKYQKGAGAFRSPYSTYETWRAALREGDPARYADCFRPALYKIEPLASDAQTTLTFVFNKGEANNLSTILQNSESVESGQERVEVEAETLKRYIEKHAALARKSSQVKKKQNRNRSQYPPKKAKPLNAILQDALDRVQRERDAIALPPPAIRLAQDFWRWRELLRRQDFTYPEWQIRKTAARLTLRSGPARFTVTLRFSTEQNGWKIVGIQSGQ